VYNTLAAPMDESAPKELPRRVAVAEAFLDCDYFQKVLDFTNPERAFTQT
jgi:hypothetical protein